MFNQLNRHVVLVLIRTMTIGSDRTSGLPTSSVGQRLVHAYDTNYGVTGGSG
jgi:hypothetical protein